MRRQALIAILALAATAAAGCGTGQPMVGTMPVAAQAGRVETNASLTTVKRRVLAALQEQYPYASITLDDILPQGTDFYRFIAFIDGRKVDGTYNNLTGRVSFGGGSGPSEPGGDLATVKRTIIRELQRRYPYASITLENVSDRPSGGVYKFAASVDGRMTQGTFDSYSGDVRLYGEPGGGGDLGQIKRTIIQELQRLYPYASVTLQDVSDYPASGQYKFSASVNGRLVYGTCDSYSGRVKVTNGGGGGSTPTDPYAARQGLTRKLHDLYPQHDIQIREMDRSSYGSYDFVAVVNGRTLYGNYDPATDRISFQK